MGAQPLEGKALLGLQADVDAAIVVAPHERRVLVGLPAYCAICDAPPVDNGFSHIDDFWLSPNAGSASRTVAPVPDRTQRHNPLRHARDMGTILPLAAPARRLGRGAMLGTLLSLLLVLPILKVADAKAFGQKYHREITRAGLSAPLGSDGGQVRFIRESLFEMIMIQQALVDSGLNVGRDHFHFDDCEFDGGAGLIRQNFVRARRGLRDERLLLAEGLFSFWSIYGPVRSFGGVLHAVQDFYAHSNWVELGFPASDVPGTSAIEVGAVDLVDLSGAQLSFGTRWFAPGFGEVVRGDVLLGADDFGAIPDSWSIAPHGGGRHIPTLIDSEGVTRGRLLVSGQSPLDAECGVEFMPRRQVKGVTLFRFSGFSHDALNKDGPDPGREQLHARAKALATLQTSWEWCRLMREAALERVEGPLLTLGIRHRGDPHPPGTTCAAGAPGPMEVTATVESVKVLRSGDGSRPGQIQLATALYDDPLDFHASKHRTSKSSHVRPGDFIPASGLPEPATLCLAPNTGAHLALYGWDNDQDGNDAEQLAGDFDSHNDNDDVLLGFRQRVLARGASTPRTLRRTTRSADLEVRYEVTASNPGSSCTLPSPEPKADLVIRDLRVGEFTVLNLGSRPAGPFTVTVVGVGDFAFPGLAAGQRLRRTYDNNCEAEHRAIADSRFQVDESNEANNVQTFVAAC